MIWFGNIHKLFDVPLPSHLEGASARRRMRAAIEWVAARAPQLTGEGLIEAVTSTGWVDADTATRLLPEFRGFDADRHFADDLRRLSFRGRTAEDDFRWRVRTIVEELTGTGSVGAVGPEKGIRFRVGEREGLVLAYPEVALSVGGSTREAIAAAVEEMPDALVVVARTFDRHAAEQVAALLHRTEVPGTLVTVNLLLGIRAMALRYRPGADRVVDLLETGRPLRSQDVARLGDRELATAA